MKKLIFGGFCFIGGLLLMLVEPSIDYGGIIDGIITVLIPAFTVFGFVLCVIGFVKKGNKEKE